MRVLVAGGRQVDAGKTTFSVGLVERLGAVGFKPRAGSNRWDDHDSYRESVAAGRLYGNDARRLATASPGVDAPETVNPVHRLWQPAPGGGSGLLGRDGVEFVVDRVGEEWLVNGTATLPERVRASLPLDRARRVTTVAGLNDAMESLHLPVLSRFGERVAGADPAVVESYSDVALPIRDVAVDLVAVVEPARLRVYDGDRYVRACRVVGGSPREGRLEPTVGDVVDHLDPLATAALPPLAGAERDDPARVARAYGHAYDALLDAV